MLKQEIKVFATGRNEKYSAEGIFDGKGVTVLKGSRISAITGAKINPIVEKRRNDRSIVSEDNEVLQDVYFRSSSTAATFVTGNISNGLRVWKLDNGKDLHSIKEEDNV